MAESPSLYDIFKSPISATVPIPDGLGLPIRKVGEDVRDQVDGADAIDVAPVKWAPALNGDRESARLRRPQGKPAKESRIFSVRGKRPIDVEQVLLPKRRRASEVESAIPAAGVVAEVLAEAVAVPESGLFGGGEVSPDVDKLNVASGLPVLQPADFMGRPSYFERGR